MQELKNLSETFDNLSVALLAALYWTLDKMNKNFFLILLITGYSMLRCSGQTREYASFQTADQIPWEQYIPSNKNFILAGEAHHVSINFSFQLSQLKYLVTKGFRHLVWEVPYSSSYIAQQYISTGNDSLLQYLAWSEEELSYWKKVFELNTNLKHGDKIHIWGIDHELGENLGGQHRARDFRKALLLLAQDRGEFPNSLRQEYYSLKNDSTISGLTSLKKRLQSLQDHPEVIIFFGDRLAHFKILVNRLDHFKVSRNDEMLEAFIEICTRFQLSESQKFIGRFGWGHTDKSYKKSMAWLLENYPSSPVKNNTFVVGVQYVSCTSAATKNGMLLANVGVVAERKERMNIATLNESDASPIKIFSVQREQKVSKWSKVADILVVFSRYPGITLLNRRMLL